jgi:hypothetical protein
MPDVEKSVEKEIKSVEKKIHKMNVWMLTSIVLIIILAGVLIYFGTAASSTQLSNEKGVSDNVLKFINNNLVQPGTNATYVSTSNFEGLYNITVEYQGRNISVFLTKDGSNMFLSSPLNISEQLPIANESTPTPAPVEVPKTDKASAQLFVMAFCPYGIQAEAAMEPVANLMGAVSNITVHFIASVSGTTPDSVSSLHGPVEAQEDLRQVCIMKYYNQTTFWKYVMPINNNCSNLRSNTTAYDACWKDAATKAGIDVSKIDACSTGSEGVNLLKADESLTTQYGISGSPTLLINGVAYNGERTPDAYKQAICSGFNTEPSLCSQSLNATAAAASGNCG